ncbi:type II secretion system minor pseudopilin GspK [Sinimarinibacterium sp. NLF-5-8]|uniref:type II secretion system minor pseudopilin GspK n=1 Tax=Sinimarinibacterium sp. NLF-5-8 TaxID=2698684 RepID=UPI00137C32AB|nr:type II secretion system minor pseudopilin GspK [Sinimarinibacterium sp. NLF-5-8]QHS09481.1 type II secretion system minor pseudopilin GspK [Sinimarinibacterium sp. NLF-5-8]
MKRPGKHRGVALITAILVVALAAIASTAILVSANLAIRRTANLQDSELGWWYANGIEAWVQSMLARDLDFNRTDARQEIMLPIDEGMARGSIIDLQGRFNLNNLGVENLEEYERHVGVWVRLLRHLEVAEEYQARALAASIRDWIDSDSQPTGADGAEDNDYLRLDPPYRTANRLLSSPSELLAIRGITPKLYTAIAQYVTALPVIPTPINVNTAEPVVLTALVSEPRPALEEFIRQREQKPAENLQDLINQGVFTASDVPNQMLATNSQFFMLRAEVLIGSGRVALYSSFFRPTGGQPAIFARSLNTP